MAWQERSLFHEDLGLSNYSTTSSSLDAANDTLFSNTTITATPDDHHHPHANALLYLGWCLAYMLFMYYCCRSKIPDERHWRGREMRQRALERRPQQLAQEARDNQSPLERKRLVQQAMITKVRKGTDYQVYLYVFYIYFHIDTRVTNRSSSFHHDVSRK
jgi:hypothetical protein